MGWIYQSCCVCLYKFLFDKRKVRMDDIGKMRSTQFLEGKRKSDIFEILKAKIGILKIELEYWSIEIDKNILLYIKEKNILFYTVYSFEMFGILSIIFFKSKI